MVFCNVRDVKAMLVFLTEHPKEERSRNVKQMLREKLPVENYELFKYLIEFLVKVSGPITLIKLNIKVAKAEAEYATVRNVNYRRINNRYSILLLFH